MSTAESASGERSGPSQSSKPAVKGPTRPGHSYSSAYVKVLNSGAGMLAFRPLSADQPVACFLNPAPSTLQIRNKIAEAQETWCARQADGFSSPLLGFSRVLMLRWPQLGKK